MTTSHTYKLMWWHIPMFPIALLMLGVYRFILPTINKIARDKIAQHVNVDMLEAMTVLELVAKNIPNGRYMTQQEVPDFSLMDLLFGNHDDGQEAAPAPGQPIIKPFAWWLRNPLHNYTFYVLGLRHRPRFEMFFDENGRPVTDMHDFITLNRPEKYLIMTVADGVVRYGIKNGRSYAGIRFGGSWGVR